jgi:hypothetical protein
MKRVSIILTLGLLVVFLFSGQAFAVPMSTEELIQRVTDRLENRIERRLDSIADIYERNPERAERVFERFFNRMERRIDRIEDRRGIDIPIDLPDSTYGSFVSVNESPSPGAAPVPEPGTMILMATGILGLGVFGRKKILQ